MATSKWSPDWPERPGLYWFYGYPINKEFDQTPRLVIVNVECKTVRGFRYMGMRMPLSKETGALGVWCPIDTPYLPKERLAITEGEE